MKKILALTVIMAFFISIVPIFASRAEAAGKTLFQTLSDSLAKMGKNTSQHKQTEWTTIFKKAGDNIETWDKNVGKTKSLSLRGNAAELAKRRGIK